MNIGMRKIYRMVSFGGLFLEVLNRFAFDITLILKGGADTADQSIQQEKQTEDLSIIHSIPLFMDYFIVTLLIYSIITVGKMPKGI